MLRFSQIATKLNSERQKSLGNPKVAGFFPNKRGIMQKAILAEISVRSKDGIQPLGTGLICYSDQDVNEESPAAELVRSNRWKNYEVGKLWLYIRGKTKLLAQIDPSGQRALASGFVTEQGQFIIDEDK